MSSVEAPGAGHGGVQEAQVPQRRSDPVEIKNGSCQVVHLSEDRPYVYVPNRSPRREPRPHKDPHTAPGSHEVSQRLALDEVSFATRKHYLHPEDILE